MTQRDINGSISLDRTWELCLEMWEYIAKMWLDPNNEDDVLTLKEKWLNKNGYKNSGIAQNCFFCNFAGDRELMTTMNHCLSKCPGKLVDKSFTCTHPVYDYEDYPVQFYHKIVELNKIRLEQKDE